MKQRFASLLFAAVFSAWAIPVQADVLSPTAGTGPGSRPFVQASLEALAHFGSSPLRLRAADSAWLIPSALGLGFLVNNDVGLYGRLAKGDARKDWLDNAMPKVTLLGEGWVGFAGATLGALLGNERFARTSRVAMQGEVVVGVYALVLKTAAWSNRPSQDDTQHRFLAYDQSSQGMPSGHSFSAFCLAEVYGAEYGRLLPYSLAGLVAYSRVYNQAHWPSDVLAGSLLGILAGIQARHQSDSLGAPALRFSLLPREDAPLLVAELSY